MLQRPSKTLQAIEVTNSFQTSQTFTIPQGFAFHGSTREQSNSSNNSEKFYGTTSSDGASAISRDLFHANINEPIVYNETLDDRKQIINKYSDRVNTNTALATYPYINPLPTLQNQTDTTLTAIAQSQANVTNSIYKCLGKGLGDITFTRVAQPIEGQPSAVGFVTEYLSNGTVLRRQKSGSSAGTLYPYDGYIYSGTLVQIIVETSPDDSSVKQVAVIPYQSGRGIPPIPTNFQPDTNPATNNQLTAFPPYGELQWVDGSTIEPDLASGVDPGDPNTCFGMVLDTFSTQNNVIYKYSPPSGFDPSFLNSDPHDSYKHHPAPHSVPPVSVIANSSNQKTQGFLSPGPNSSGTYYAPWPRYYAYQPGDPIPVLTRGLTTARIGAACNIALMAYGLSVSLSATDETWIAIPCIPLFQGEILHAGSTIYASVKGNIMTAGPYQDIVTTEAPNTFQNTTVKGVVGQHPWDHYIDSTYGNYGWTGTPGLSFYNIPDHSIAIPEITADSSGVAKALPYLNQANQGTIIVHPITENSLTPALGNNYLQTNYELYANDYTEDQAEDIRKARSALRALSGRCVLPQEVPAKSVPIGTLMETIEGTGRWTFTGLPIGEPTGSFNAFPYLVTGGAVYANHLLDPIPLRDGSGTGMTGTYTDTNIYPPTNGTVSDPVISNDGSGYANGDILTFQDNIAIPPNSYTFNTTPQYKSNNAAVIYSDTPALTLYKFGSGYSTTGTSVIGWNLSVHSSVYYSFNVNADGSITSDAVGGIPSLTSYYQDVSNFGPGTVIRVVDDSVNYENSGYCLSNNYPSTTSFNYTAFDFFSGSGVSGIGYPLVNETHCYETQLMDYRISNLLVDYTATGGHITGITIRDFGAGNKVGDRILIQDGDFNAVFEFQGLPTGYQEIITAGGPSHISNGSEFYHSVLAGTNTDLNLTFFLASNTFNNQNDFTNDDREAYTGSLFLPVAFNKFTGPGSPTVGVYNLRLGSLAPSVTVHQHPWYHLNCCAVEFTASGDWVPRRGGSGYTTATGVKCYNLSANSLRVEYIVNNGILGACQSGATSLYRALDFIPLRNRYVFDSTSGTQVRVLNDFTDENSQEILQLNSFVPFGAGLSTTVIRKGGLYPTAPTGNNILFQTQRLDQTNPTVDITVTAGQINTVKLRTPGINNQKGDLILIVQEESGNNGIFLYNDNMQKIDLPPYAEEHEGYSIDRTEEAWLRYSEVMESAVNLFDKQVLIDLNPNTCEQPMDNILPYGYVGGGREQPTTANIYRNEYTL